MSEIFKNFESTTLKPSLSTRVGLNFDHMRSSIFLVNSRSEVSLQITSQANMTANSSVIQGLFIEVHFITHQDDLLKCIFYITPAGIYLLKVNNKKTRARCEICSKLTIKIPEQATGVVLVSLFLTLNIFHTLF